MTVASFKHENQRIVSGVFVTGCLNLVNCRFIVEEEHQPAKIFIKPGVSEHAELHLLVSQITPFRLLPRLVTKQNLQIRIAMGIAE